MLEKMFSVTHTKDLKYKIYNILGFKIKTKNVIKIKFAKHLISTKKSITTKNFDYKNKRACVFASFNKDGLINENVVKYLSELKKFNDIIVFVADNPVDKNELNKIDTLVDGYIFKRHNKYDFGSYKLGYKLLEKHNILKNIDSLLFCNDSVNYVANDLTQVFEKSKNCDFYGITANNTGVVNLYKDIYVEKNDMPHIQSYFVILSNKIFTSKWFKKFINSVKKEKNKYDIIINYEIGLSNLLTNKEFTLNTFYNFNKEEKPYEKYLTKQNEDTIFLKKVY